ncbi:MAG TPA: family 20 glycosylhydrolase [Pyrinomonadaceae bacterium]
MLDRRSLYHSRSGGTNRKIEKQRNKELIFPFAMMRETVNVFAPNPLSVKMHKPLINLPGRWNKTLIMKLSVCFAIAVMLCASTCISTFAKSKEPKPWRALHLLNYNTDADLELLGTSLETLAKRGINVIVLEVNYNFAFKSHPELSRGTNPITSAGARRLSELCKKFKIRLIPEFQSLGHQSWKAETFPLLTAYPKFDLTPGAFPNNEGIYCREWDPLNPEVWKVVFKLMDEIVDAFHADALHVGMDEVFLLGSEQSPSTKGKDPALLFANAVKEIHSHLVGKRHIEMLMWGDRLIDSKQFGLGEWEASMNGTASAIDMIPKDIIICPWHYEQRDSYPSIPMFLEKGFRVLPAGWKNVEATKALIEYSRLHASPRLLGHMFTTWGVEKDALLDFPPLVEGLKLLGSE